MAAQASSDVVRDATGSPKQRGSARTQCGRNLACSMTKHGLSPTVTLLGAPCVSPFVDDTRACVRAITSRSYMASAKHSWRETRTVTRHKRYFMTAIVRTRIPPSLKNRREIMECDKKRTNFNHYATDFLETR